MSFLQSFVAGIAFLTLGALAPGTQAATRVERELPLEPGGRLVLRAEGSTVSVVGTSRATARVVITAKADIESTHDVTFGEDPGRATVTIERKEAVTRWFHWFWGSDLRVEIELPARASVEIDTSGGAIRGADVGGELHAKTSGGAIDLQRIAGGIHAETSGGGIWITGAGATVDAHTSGGAIEIRDAGGDVRARTSGGPVRVFSAGGRVDAESSGGPVDVEFRAGNGHGGTLSSAGGRVRATIDPTVDLEIDATASGGNVAIDVPLRVRGEASKSHVHGTLGKDGEMLTLRSSGGGVRIEPSSVPGN